MEREQSEFNMAVSYLNRLNNLLYICDDASMNLNTHIWFHSLLTLFREISTELKPSEIQEWETIINELNHLINESYKNKRGEISQDLYMNLHKFEIKIRKVLKDTGLQMKMQDDAMNSLR